MARDRSPDEEDLSATCADCGAPMDASERSYAFSEGSVLCWACAIRRGGRHDPQEDTWVTAPAIADLLPRDRD